MPRTASAIELVTWFKDRNLGSCRLAESVSLAVHVGPELLRRARLELNPGVGVGAEADLWFSPLVESTSASGIVFRADVAAILRERLRDDMKRLEAAWRLLQRFHAFAPPAIVLEERVTWAALTKGEQAREEINRLLGSAVRVMLSSPEREFGMARWAQRALPRLPVHARETEAGAALAFGAAIRMRGQGTRSQGALPSRLTRSATRVLPASTGRTQLRLYRERHSIVFIDPKGEVPGHDLEVPATTPVILDLEWREGEEERQRLVFPETGLREVMPESVEIIRIRALDGREWDFVTELEKPREPDAESAESPEKRPTRHRPVFISHAASTSRPHAEALHRALGGDLAFIDSMDIEQGTHLLGEVAKGLSEARVVVIFADKKYFGNAYCLRELRAALSPYLSLPPNAPEPKKREALEHIVLALPSSESLSLELLPPPLRYVSWPRAHDTGSLEELVRARLSTNPMSLAARLAALGREQVLRDLVVEPDALPDPKNLASIRRYPQALPPSLGDSFVGRTEELWRIDFALNPGGPERPTVVSLEGTAGTGKTRLALEYVHRFGPRRFSGGIFWVNADVGEDQLEEQLHGILRTLRPDAPELGTLRRHKREVRKELVAAIRLEAAQASILYVVDGIPEHGPDMLPQPLETWCPALGLVPLLLTSRATLSLSHPGVVTIPMTVLPSESAIALLTSGLATPVLERAEWERVAAWVGHLPLALELLNRALRAGTLEPAELLQRTERHSPGVVLDNQADQLRPHVPAGALPAVSEAFRVSYERLSEEEQHAADAIAWLAPEPIPMLLIDKLGAELADSEVRAILKSRHFVTSVEEGSVPLFGVMHRLLADFLRSRSENPAQHLRSACEALLELMTPEACEDPNSWPLLDTCLPHGEHVFQQSMGLRERTLVEGRLELANRLVLFMESRGLLARAENMGRSAMQQASSELGEEHLSTWMAIRQLAEVLQLQGKYGEARSLLERLVELDRRIRGPKHPETLSSIHTLAVLLGNMGALGEARTLLESVLQSRLEVSGEEHPDTLAAMSNLAMVLLDMGELSHARKLFERVLAEYRVMMGSEHPDTLRVTDKLAQTLQAQGELDYARLLQEEVLATRRRVLGEVHPDTLQSLTHVAQLLRAQGNLERGHELEQRALAISRRALGEEHPYTLTAMSNLALTLHAQGNLEEARELAERTLRSRLQVLGDEHPETLMAMNNLALSLADQDEFDRARELFGRTLEVRRRVLGEEHPDTLTAMSNLASVLREQGQFETARELFERTVEVRRRVLGEEHPDTLTAVSNLASLIRELGEVEMARVLVEGTLEVRRRTQGLAHPDTLRSMVSLAVILQQQGNLAGARRLLKEAQEVSQRVLGEDHVLTHFSRKMLSELEAEKERS